MRHGKSKKDAHLAIIKAVDGFALSQISHISLGLAISIESLSTKIAFLTEGGKISWMNSFMRPAARFSANMRMQ
jgi:hypothetical protein